VVTGISLWPYDEVAGKDFKFNYFGCGKVICGPGWKNVKKLIHIIILAKTAEGLRKSFIGINFPCHIYKFFGEKPARTTAWTEL